MSDTAAAFCDVRSFDGRVFALVDTRRLGRTVRVLGDTVIIGLGTVAALGLLVGTVTVAAAWLLSIAISSNPQLRAQAPRGPETLALVRHATRLAAATDLSIPTVSSHDVAELPRPTFEAQWANVMASVPASIAAPERPVVQANIAPPPKAVIEQANSVPLPRPYPAVREIAQAPVEEVGPPAPQQVAAVAPPPQPAPTVEKRVAPQPVHNKSMALPEPDSRTAIYDISARTVYMPSGRKLEAHSGLGEKIDDPRFVHVRMRGATPPNVYQLTMREKLFHGVRAIRLNPVDNNKMFGRDGMLAHTYMLGPNGQSNGCVSFKDYDAFLNAYLNGEVDRLVVVSHMGDAPAVLTAKVRRGPVSRYASTDAIAPSSIAAQ